MATSKRDLPLLRLNPSQYDGPRALVKGLKGVPAAISGNADLVKLNATLRRRHLGILDEQTLLEKKTMKKTSVDNRRGISNFFVTEFVTPPPALPTTTSSSSSSDVGGSCAGFQCVARKNIFEDFTATPQHSSVKYKICLRHIPPHEVGECRRSVDDIQTKGFLNYFYGSDIMAPHARKGLLPGLMLLQGSYAAAFELICRAPRLLRYDGVKLFHDPLEADEGEEEGENNSENKNNGGGNARRQHHQHRQKLSVLAATLSKHKPLELTDPLCKNVLESVLGVEGCTHFVREFAAMVWNDCLTRRVKTHGPRSIVVGDLFEAEKQGEQENDQCLLEGRKDETKETIARGDDVDYCRRDDDDDVVLRQWFNNNNDSHGIIDNLLCRDVHQVMLPTIGYAVPTTTTSSPWTDAMTLSLKKFGITSSSSSSCSSYSSSSLSSVMASLQLQTSLWNLPGEYRRVVEYPRNLKWRLEPDYDLSLEELGFRFASPSSSVWTSSSETTTRNEQKKTLLHKLTLSFDLPHGVSPWMMLREMSKRERHIIDVGHVKAIAERGEQKKVDEAERNAVRRRLYKRVKKRFAFYGGTGGGGSNGVPQGLETARLQQSIFHHNGPKQSLIPHLSKNNMDVRS